MERQTYPAARRVSTRLQAHFVQHAGAAAGRTPRTVATVPQREEIEAMIDAAFWASLRREEGYAPTISLASLSPQETVDPMIFERPLSLAAGALTKVAPAVTRAGIHLGVSVNDGELRVWGAARALPAYCFVLEVAAPGLLVVKHQRGEELGKFVNVAVIEGDDIKVIDENASSLPDCPELVSSLLGFDSPASWVRSVNILVQLAVSMRSHRHGGTLLVVRADNTAWRDSIVRPIPYAVSPAFTALSRLVREMPVDRPRQWQETLAHVIDSVAGLTAVDGATIISTEFELLAFGAKIARRKGGAFVDQVMMTEPIEGSGAERIDPAQLGGTRHLSAAQFVNDQRDATALVASQDGRFTVFAWSPCEEMVHAHRVETLLL